MFSSRRKLIPLLLLALATALVAVACGSDSDQRSVPAGAIALVGDQEIAKEDLDRLIVQTKTNYEAQQQDFPAAGTPAYENIKGSLVRSLVQQAQWEQAGAEMGLKVSDEEIDKELEALKKQYFKGDQDKYEAELYIHYYACRLGLRVIEVPVTIDYSRLAADRKSKMRPFSGWWSLARPSAR